MLRWQKPSCATLTMLLSRRFGAAGWPARMARRLVGHSFSGMIVTEAGIHPERLGAVLCAARAPDAGEDSPRWPDVIRTRPGDRRIVFDGDEGRLSEEAFVRDFAGDLPEAKAKVLCAVQEPFHKALLTGKPRTRLGDPSRATMPSQPRTARSSDLERFMASGWEQRPSSEGQPSLIELASRGDRG